MAKIKNRIITEIERNQNIKDEEIENTKEKGNIFDNIFENNSFETNADFISLLTSELEQKFSKNLTKFIINAEKQSILSSLSRDLPGNVRKIWEEKLEQFDFTKDINNNLKSNTIKVWTKLNLPSIYFLCSQLGNYKR